MPDTSSPNLSLDHIEDGLRQSLTNLMASADPPEKIARSVSAILKSLDDIAAHRTRMTEREQAETHTRIEDLPPPNPAELARFYDRFYQLYDAILDARGTPPPD